jgi:DNA polymerase III epsilon subunit family exonuclease
MVWLRPLWRWPRRHGPSLDALVTGGFVAIDLETTGLDPRRDAVVAAAAIEIIAGDPRPGYATLVNPGSPIPSTATAVHGITDAAVASAPRIEEVLEALEAVCGDRVLVGHRIDFDVAILTRERRLRGLPAPRNATVCTMRLAAALHPAWPDVGLDAVAARLAIPIPDRHTARGDALASARILLAMLPELGRRGIRTLDELLWLQSTASLSG